MGRGEAEGRGGWAWPGACVVVDSPEHKVACCGIGTLDVAGYLLKDVGSSDRRVVLRDVGAQSTSLAVPPGQPASTDGQMKIILVQAITVHVGQNVGHGAFGHRPAKTIRAWVIRRDAR